MSKIYCVMCANELEFGETSLGCYRTEDEAKKALEFWNQGDYSSQWIVEHDLYSKFKESDLMK